VYTAETISLAMLEILVHVTEIPTDYRVSAIAIPDNVSMETIARQGLPKGWNAAAGSSGARAFGSKWVKEARSAVLSLPSSVVRNERIFVLNPAHPEFAQIEFGRPAPHVFDARLK
jgi:RES domain-containing protein